MAFRRLRRALRRHGVAFGLIGVIGMTFGDCRMTFGRLLASKLFDLLVRAFRPDLRGAGILFKPLHDGVDLVFGVIDGFRQFDVGVARLDDDGTGQRIRLAQCDVGVHRLDINAKKTRCLVSLAVDFAKELLPSGVQRELDGLVARLFLCDGVLDMRHGSVRPA